MNETDEAFSFASCERPEPGNRPSPNACASPDAHVLARIGGVDPGMPRIAVDAASIGFLTERGPTIDASMFS
ncbi:MAG: hypothetical protein GXY82_08795 [Methanospirillum sp.]|nr:hypothetical protein [Methanospirillum sp.]